MRRQSNKQRALYDAHREMRRQMVNYAACSTGCWHCGGLGGLACHEVLSGPNRMRAFGERACLLVLCSICNCDQFTDKSKFPLARQLAIKLINDPEHFDLEKVRRVAAPEGCKTPPVLVTADEILEWTRKELI